MGNKKLTSVSPGLIDQIYRFENINDFTKQIDLEEMIQEQLELNTRGHKGRKKRGRHPKPSTYSQFGYESNG
jgi:hypothetical protein